MKKLFPFLLTVLFFSSLSAQRHQNDNPNLITIMAGWNYSKYQVGKDGPLKGDYKSGAIIGVNRDLKITPFIWMNGGLFYVQNGATTRLGDYHFDYLMLPAGIKLRLGSVYVMGGLYGAYRLTAVYDGDKLPQKDYNRFDFGSYAGFGAKVNIFSLNIKYNWGLLDVTNGSSDSPSFDLTNEFLSVTLGVGIK